jgi:hypothetical protein
MWGGGSVSTGQHHFDDVDDAVVVVADFEESGDEEHAEVPERVRRLATHQLHILGLNTKN